MEAQDQVTQHVSRVVVVGASAGGVESLRAFVSALPADLPAAVLVVLHLSPHSTSVLPRILARGSKLSVHGATGTADLAPATVLVAGPDHHLVVLDGRTSISRGPHENGHRPAVDVLFRSAARANGPRVIAVVLSGTLDDGTAGAMAVHQHGGTVLAEKPETAAYPSMPRSVIDHVPVTATGTPAELAVVVGELCRVDTREINGTTSGTGPGEIVPGSTRALMDREMIKLAAMDEDEDEVNDADRPGVPAGYACPDCHGMLFQLEDDMLRCRVGHVWTPQGLLAEHATALDSALWMALRSLEEKAALSRQLAERAHERGSRYSQARFQTQAEESAHSATLVRRLLQSPPTDGTEIPAEFVRVSDV